MASTIQHRGLSLFHETRMTAPAPAPDDQKPEAASNPATVIARESLSVWDAISIIVGIVVGVSIFKVPAIVFSNVPSGIAGLGLWALAGGLCLVGALCYAELATRFKQGGGEYLFLTRGLGREVGFLYGWAQLTGVFSGAVGTMAYVFADYAVQLSGSNPHLGVWWAISAIWTLTAIHILGVKSGKLVQNVLTSIKVIGLLSLLVVGFSSSAPESLVTSIPAKDSNVGLAMILVLYAYGGWNDAAFASAEVREPHRNIPRALTGGMLAIAVLYVLVNWAYLQGLGLSRLRTSFTPASDLMAQATWLSPAIRDSATKVVGLLVMASALGAIHGMIFTGSRLYFAMGVEHPLFARLGRLHAGSGSPVSALLVQALMTSLLILTVGTATGRAGVDWSVSWLGRAPIPWDKYFGGFDTLLAATAPVFWSFFLLNGFTLFIFRARSIGDTSGFRVPLYPITPLIFCGTCGFMLYQSILYAQDLTWLALLPLLAGVPVYFYSNALRRA